MQQQEVWLTSDTHYGHANIIEYSKRPYQSVQGMNESLIANYNSVVRPGDLVYHLGDFGFADEKSLDEILRRLNGDKFLIWGNHDKTLRNSARLQGHFVKCLDYLEISVDKTRIVLCHYPMLSWNRMAHGSIMAHGHCHGNLRYPFKGRIIDVGVDPQDYFQVNARNVVKRLADVEVEFLDHHVGD